jgi:toxin ParE1/3/4
MSRMLFSPAARADIEQIWDHTAEKWGEHQAEKCIRNIDTTCRDIAAGRIHGISAENIRTGYRKIGVGSHLIFFRQNEGSFEVIRILHQRMDVTTHLKSQD